MAGIGTAVGADVGESGITVAAGGLVAGKVDVVRNGVTVAAWMSGLQLAATAQTSAIARWIFHTSQL